MWNQVCQALPGVALCDLDDGELRDGRWDPNLVRSGSDGGGDVDESCEEGVHGAVPVVDRGALVIGERDSREHPLKVVLRLEQLALARLLGGVEVLSLIHISEPTRLLSISYAVFCLKKKKKKKKKKHYTTLT